MKERVAKFVTREHLDFTKSEIDSIVKHISSQFEGNVYNINFAGYEYEKDDYLKTLTLKFSMPTYSGRDSENARCTISSISFLIWKSKGEIEIDWKNKIYNPYDLPVYSGTMIVHSEYIPYHCRRKENYQKGSQYNYGDEIVDLDYTPFIKQLYKDLQYMGA